MEVVGKRGTNVYAIRDGDRFAPFDAGTMALGLWGPAEVLEARGYWIPFDGSDEEARLVLEAVRKKLGLDR